MNISSYASLLAQVIPVVLLAVIIETRNIHETYQKVLRLRNDRENSAARGNRSRSPGFVVIPERFRALLPVMLGLQCIFVGYYVVLEVASLIAARYQHPGLSGKLIESTQSFLFIGFGFFYVMLLSALATNQLYQELRALSDGQRRGMHWLLRFVGFVIVLGTPLLLRGVR